MRILLILLTILPLAARADTIAFDDRDALNTELSRLMGTLKPTDKTHLNIIYSAHNVIATIRTVESMLAWQCNPAVGDIRRSRPK